MTISKNYHDDLLAKTEPFVTLKETFRRMTPLVDGAIYQNGVIVAWRCVPYPEDEHTKEETIRLEQINGGDMRLARVLRKLSRMKLKDVPQCPF